MPRPNDPPQKGLLRGLVAYRVIRDIAQTSDYLRRWSLRLPFGWSLKLHEIVRPDDDRCEHDHPWWFWRLILRGGYVEEIEGVTRVRKPLSLTYCGAKFRHRITELRAPSSWSLVLCGPKLERWGFYTKAGWMHWRAFVDAAVSARVMWCEDGRLILRNADRPENVR